MKLMSPNLAATQLKNVDTLLAEMLVDKPVTGEFIGSIVSAVGNAVTSAASDVGNAVTDAATAVGNAATDVATFVTAHKTAVASVATQVATVALEAAADSAAAAVAVARPLMIKRRIVTALKSNKAQALSLQELIMLRKEAMN